ncbi:molybdopterin-dependent oxidoreductase [Candidatus Protofrankia datiscae]|uniref:Oxidoreductase molybdopterin binding protein n=1 Tax=Candidatus Protofrankia datiscae TaxID=2716812 RepID=F8B3M8_9ACTN|nr:molybdopterin-dependent oxidoreductase [Candidatus Protofrankia datiscae]AEH07866.1 oxidoreductase molybdopterin binding protein [Candidatus Protofrankia datiscae]
MRPVIGLFTGRFPRPPAIPRRGPLRADAFTSRLHDPRVASLLGVWLGIAFGVCFLTGLVSHFMQHPPSWYLWPSRPVSLYRVTQGLHVTTGLVCVPLLLVKLWTVYPRLWEWPPVRSAVHALERLSIVPLIAGAVFQLATGIADTAQWYRFRFFFTATHYWVAWITIGALSVHVVAKLAVVRANVGRGRNARQHLTDRVSAPEPPGDGLSRRGLGIAVTSAAGVIAATTAGQWVPGLAGLDLLGTRRPDIGPQGLPVNRTAVAARVTAVARDPGYRLEVAGPRPFALTLDGLRAFPHHESKLPITCVEGWAADATWRGPRLRDLLDAAGVPADATVQVESLEAGGAYRTSEVRPPHARDPLTLLATVLNGAELDVDHGYPARLIAPNRPGVLQTKWVHRVVML